MDKYKIVGLVDLLVGLIALVIPSIILFSVLPKALEVYQDFGASYSPTLTYSGFVVVFLISVVNLFFSFKLFRHQGKNGDRYYNLGIISAIVTFILILLIPAFLSYSTLVPMFNLVNVIK